MNDCVIISFNYLGDKMKKILFASDNFGFSTNVIHFLNSIQHNYDGFEIVFVSNLEDLLYKLYFEGFDADMVFMNLDVCQFDFPYLSFFEEDLQNAITDIMSTSSNEKIVLGKIFKYLVNAKYNKQLDIILLDAFDSLDEITKNEMYGINLNTYDLVKDVLNILDLIQEKSLM